MVCHYTRLLDRRAVIKAVMNNNVHIQFYGEIRAAANKPAEEVAPHSTVFDLFCKLADGYGPVFRGEIFKEDGSSLRDDLTVTINGATVRHEATHKLVAAPGDVIAIFPVFPGGG